MDAETDGMGPRLDIDGDLGVVMLKWARRGGFGSDGGCMYVCVEQLS